MDQQFVKVLFYPYPDGKGGTTMEPGAPPGWRHDPPARTRKLFTPPVLDADEWAMAAEAVEARLPLLAARIYDAIGLYGLSAAARDLRKQP